MPQTASSFSTSASLIHRVKARDSEAWNRLSRLYGPLAYRWTRQCGLQPQDAADVVQNVFIAVAQHVDRYSSAGPQSSFRGWLWTITRNAIRDFQRQQAIRPQAEGGSDAHARIQQVADTLDASHDDPDQSAGFDVAASLTHHALQLIQEDFEPRTWSAFWRMTINEESAAEVGQALGLSTKAVRQAKYRVLCRLRELLADD